MAACCAVCGGIIVRDRETIVLSEHKWYAHRAGSCPDCGNRVQWHRTLAGRLGCGYLYLYSPRPLPCSQSCPHYEQTASLALQI